MIIVTASLRHMSTDHSHAASYKGTTSISKHTTTALNLRDSLDFSHDDQERKSHFFDAILCLDRQQFCRVSCTFFS